MTTKMFPPHNKFMLDVMKACRSGDLQIIHNAISSGKIQVDEKNYPNQMLIFACVNGHLDICKAIFNSPELENKVNNQVTIKNCIDRAFNNANINIIEFLLEKVGEIGLKHNAIIYNGMISAIRLGYLDVIKHFLDKEPLYGICEKEIKEGGMLSTAFTSNCLDIIKYLLDESILKDKYDIHMHKDVLFKTAYNNNYVDTLKYLIFEKRVEKTKSIETHLEYSQLSNGLEINKWFDSIKLHSNLQEDLPKLQKSKSSKKIKV